MNIYKELLMLKRARSSTPLKSLDDQKRSMRTWIDRDYRNLETVVCIEDTNLFCFNKHCLICQSTSLLVNCLNRHFNDLVFKERLNCYDFAFEMKLFVFKMKLLGSLNPYLNSLNTFKVLNNNCFISSILYYKKLNKTPYIGNRGGILC